MKYRILKILFGLVLLAYAFASCDKKIDEPELCLSIGDEVEVNQGLKITFEDIIEDSRCPLNASCVWEGQAIVDLLLLIDEEVHDLQLIKRAERENLADTTLGKWQIRLLEVDPYPIIATDTIARDEYQIKLEVDQDIR